ncbi:hypothetical protein [Chishuiella sp.]|uniref:hypothetical protein n=1 Tax=Chishuiella sp. TaxID=1969467 RepID=UPI0028AFAA47|nr:hypothetical protein [Chishuiella sp.]
MKKDELNNDFKVPENYFNNLQDKILLNSLKKEDSFDVPKKYFSQLEKVVSKKHNQKEFIGKNKKIFRLNYWLSAACILVFVLLSVEIFLMNKQKSDQQIVNAKVEKEVYQKIYDSFIEDNQNTKSSNITLDDSDYTIYNY